MRPADLETPAVAPASSAADEAASPNQQASSDSLHSVMEHQEERQQPHHQATTPPTHTFRSPLHHGTEPDLNAPVTACQLDVSPIPPSCRAKLGFTNGSSATIATTGVGKLAAPFPKHQQHRQHRQHRQRQQGLGTPPLSGTGVDGAVQQRSGDHDSSNVNMNGAAGANGKDAAAAAGADGGGGIDDMMCRAKKAANHIFLLTHARRCTGGCGLRTCGAAKLLLRHVGSCGASRCTPSCMQAKKLLQHADSCRASRGSMGSLQQLSEGAPGRLCLVCSLVARYTSQFERGAAASAAAAARAAKPAALGAASDGGGAGTGRGGRGDIAQPEHKRKVHAAALWDRDVDGFIKPMPRPRSVSWNGHDRCSFRQRPRFDSIPEEPLLECDRESEHGSASGSSTSADATDPRAATSVTAKTATETKRCGTASNNGTHATAVVAAALGSCVGVVPGAGSGTTGNGSSSSETVPAGTTAPASAALGAAADSAAVAPVTG